MRTLCVRRSCLALAPTEYPVIYHFWGHGLPTRHHHPELSHHTNLFRSGFWLISTSLCQLKPPFRRSSPACDLAAENDPHVWIVLYSQKRLWRTTCRPIGSWPQIGSVTRDGRAPACDSRGWALPTVRPANMVCSEAATSQVVDNCTACNVESSRLP